MPWDALAAIAGVFSAIAFVIVERKRLMEWWAALRGGANGGQKPHSQAAVTLTSDQDGGTEEPATYGKKWENSFERGQWVLLAVIGISLALFTAGALVLQPLGLADLRTGVPWIPPWRLGNYVLTGLLGIFFGACALWIIWTALWWVLDHIPTR